MEEVDWESEGDSITAIVEEKSESSCKRRKTQYSREETAKAIKFHKEYLLAAVKNAFKTLVYATDTSVILTLENIIPQNLFNLDKNLDMKYCRQLCSWMSGTFSVMDSNCVTTEEGRDGSCPSDLLNIINSRMGTITQLQQIFYSVCVIIGIPVRLVFSIDPLPPCTSSLKRLDDNEDDENISNLYNDAAESESDIIPMSWLEIYVQGGNGPSYNNTSTSNKCDVVDLMDLSDDSSIAHYDCSSLSTSSARSLSNSDGAGSSSKAGRKGAWVNVDPFRHVLDSKLELELKHRRGKRCFRYVIAFNAFTKSIEDVTGLYTNTPLRTMKYRLHSQQDINWWYSSLKERGERYMRKYPAENAYIAELVYKYERLFADPDTKQMVTVEDMCSTTMPTTLQDFKSHPKYILKKHMHSLQALYPSAKPLGIFEGDLIYNTADVSPLKTRYQWQKEYRLVHGSEGVSGGEETGTSSSACGVRGGDCAHGPEARPYRVVTSTFKGRVVKKEYFARWQTVPTSIPSVVDGVIPTNNYGNIEVWGGDGSRLPAGVVYLKSKFAQEIATTLQIYHVCAVVGFETHYQHNSLTTSKKPVMQGIVILSEDAELLQEQVEIREMEEDRKLKEAKVKVVLKRWRHLLKLVISRIHLKDEFGY